MVNIGEENVYPQIQGVTVGGCRGHVNVNEKKGRGLSADGSETRAQCTRLLFSYLKCQGP